MPTHHAIPPRPFQNALLAWYTTNKRQLPWRKRADAYAIWLAEIMLQQTTVTTVVPYFENFLARFPTITHLAAAEEQDVLHLWQGLGYYSRARNLHACAKVVTATYHGHFPTTEQELLTLPGIGPYTAAAIAAQAFNQPATVVDGNVERVISRLYCVEKELPKAKPTIKALAAPLTSPTHAGDYANAIMELGATCCTPTKPNCPTCPVNSFCLAFQQAQPTAYPKKAAKKSRPAKHGQAWVVVDAAGAVFLRQRPATGLLASLWEVPSTGWENTQKRPEKDPKTTPFFPTLSFTETGSVTHVFTHFSLTLSVHFAQIETQKDPSFFPKNQLPPLPTLMRKVLAQANVL